MPRKKKDRDAVCLVTTIPLKVEKWQADRLEKRFDTARTIYNSMLNKKLALYRRYTNTPEYKKDQATINQLFKDYEKKYPTKKEADAATKKDPVYRQIYNVKRNGQLKELGFTEFGIMGDAIKFADHFPTISSNMAQLTIGKPMWSAFEKYIYGEGEKVSFKNRKHPLNSLASNGKSGIRFKEDDEGKPYIIMKGGNRKNDLNIYLNEKGIDAHTKGVLQGDIKIIRVIRRMEYTKWHYYVQLTAENPVLSGRKERKYGHGKVGIFIDNHTGELTAVSKAETYHVSLLLDTNKVAEKKAELQAKLDAVKRANNPDNFNEDGTIKKGKKGENGKRQRLEWNISRQHKELQRQINELDRKLRVRKNNLRYEVMHDLLAMGDEFYIKKSNRRLKKSKHDEENPENNKSNTELEKEKAQRKIFQSIAASDLIVKLNNALKLEKKETVHELTIPKTHYFYQHEENCYYSKKFHGEEELSDGYVEVKGKMIPKGEYFAFIDQYFDDETKTYDKEQIEKDIVEFDFFKSA